MITMRKMTTLSSLISLNSIVFALLYLCSAQKWPAASTSKSKMVGELMDTETAQQPARQSPTERLSPSISDPSQSTESVRLPGCMDTIVQLNAEKTTYFEARRALGPIGLSGRRKDACSKNRSFPQATMQRDRDTSTSNGSCPRSDSIKSISLSLVCIMKCMIISPILTVISSQSSIQAPKLCRMLKIKSPLLRQLISGRYLSDAEYKSVQQFGCHREPRHGDVCSPLRFWSLDRRRRGLVHGRCAHSPPSLLL